MTPAAHTTSSAGITSPLGEPHAVGSTSATRADVRTLTPQLASSSLPAASRQPLGQRRQDAVGRLDQDEPHVLVGIDAVEAVRHERARRVVQLGGELDAGGAGADDRDVQLLGAQRLGLRVRADVRVDEPPVEALGLGRVSSAIACSRDARRAEVVGQAADGDHERVVADRRAAA